MAARTWRVVSHAKGWKVKRDGATRAVRIYATKSAAVDKAREIAHGNEPSRVVIHRKDGTIQEQSDYGRHSGLSYAGVFEGPSDLGTQDEKYLAERFSSPDAAR